MEPLFLGVSLAERRVKAPHPGPGIAKEYLERLGISVEFFAGLVGMDAKRLVQMLAGNIPVDVDAAVRFGRSLGISPERIMGAQLRHDFENSRAVEHDMPQPPSNTLTYLPFPPNALRGYLASVNGHDALENLFFVHGDGDDERNADLERVHPLTTGDRLRVFLAGGTCIWSGPVVKNLDGKPLFVFAKRHAWEAWFDGGFRAEWSPALRAVRAQEG